MRGIHDYSVKELKKLHGEFKKLKTYEDKVAFVYSRFGKVYGHINQEVGGLDFSIKPRNNEENVTRWRCFFDIKKEEILERLMADYRGRYEKAPDQVEFINASLLEIRKIYESNSSLLYGYEMGSLAKGLDWIHWDQVNMNYTDTLEPYCKGLAYYWLEQWLKRLKDETSVDDEFLRSNEQLSIPVLVSLIKEIGLIEHLNQKYPKQQPKDEHCSSPLRFMSCCRRKGFAELQKDPHQCY